MGSNIASDASPSPASARPLACSPPASTGLAGVRQRSPRRARHSPKRLEALPSTGSLNSREPLARAAAPRRLKGSRRAQAGK